MIAQLKSDILLLTFAILESAAAFSGPEIRQMPDGILLRLDSTFVRIIVCDQKSFHVQVYCAPFVHPSLVVTKQWKPPAWKFRSDDSLVFVSTRDGAATLDCRTGSIVFSDPGGRTIVQEDPVSPHELVPATVAGEKTYHVTQRFRLSSGEGLYGLGQFENGIMNYRNHQVTLIQNNRHVCVPFLVSSMNYGIYWDNYSHTEFHDGPDGMSFWSEVADGIDYYIFLGSDADEVIAGYRNATGAVPMFPKWAFGYWQSKERYENQDQVMSVAREYRNRGIPIDNIVQDWQYWGKLGWNAMAFDSTAYPDPRGMIDSLHSLYHMQMMISIWPQVDPNTPVFRALEKGGHLYPTEIWNGGKTYDAYSPVARDIFWEYLNKGLYSIGIDAWWVDATEPDWKWCDSLLEEKEGILRNGMTALGISARYLNTYPLMATQGIYEHQRRSNPGRRVVMLTRSAFAGQQRNSMAIWSGDISSTWDVFRNQIAGGINFSLAGIPYWNSDIGGFLPKEYGGEYPLGPRDPAYRELYVRWFQFGAFCPVFRAHGTDFPREIWEFGEPGSWSYDALLKFDRLRYRLLPYIYSTAWNVTDRHSTMMRGLPMDFSSDERVLSIGTEYMFGPAFLVSPVTTSMYYPRNPGVLIPVVDLRSPDGLPGLRGEYFRGKAFDTLALTRRDTSIRFNWSQTGAPGVGKSNFTVRWVGQVQAPEDGRYEFEITSDDGVNLFVNGLQIMDEMYPAGRQMNVGEIELKADTSYAIRLEYQQLEGGSEIELKWRTPSMIAHYKPSPKLKYATVYLPRSAGWYDFWTGEYCEGGKEIQVPAPIDIMPLHVRTGSIVPMGPVVQYANQKSAEPLELRLYRGNDGRFDLYEDANDGYGYEKGQYSTITFAWNEKSQTLTISPRQGEFPGMLTHRIFHLVVVTPGHGVGEGTTSKPDRIINYEGKEVRVKLDRGEG